MDVAKVSKRKTCSLHYFFAAAGLAGLVCAGVVLTPLGFTGVKPELYEACFSGDCYHVETAETSEQRALGLMYRKSLDEKSGMLFIFERQSFYPIWMKNMVIPIDILWLDSEKKIVDLRENVPPCSQTPCSVYEPVKPALYVLELKAGTVFKTGMKSGDLITLAPAPSAKHN